MKMSKYVVFLIFLALLFLCTNRITAEGREGINVITTADLKSMLDSKNTPTLVYCMSPIEWANEHIPKSECIPTEIMWYSSKMPEDLNTPLIFYCKGPK
jgi:rhodanese-related sulfurtransferase